jgi:hypothetical protein
MPALIPLLLGIAPTVADWIFGDKTGAAIGKVTDIAKDILGTDDAGGIERAIAADPNLALQFKQAIIQAAADARRVELDSFRAQLADVQSARTQTVDLAKANSAIAWGAPIISAIVLAAFGMALWAVLKQEVPAGSRDIANIMLGTLGAMASAVVGYWVGSSAGSASKDNTLRQIAGK